jgi:protein-L-isoaspartate(D-aspartate) O-methyltransferase
LKRDWERGEERQQMLREIQSQFRSMPGSIGESQLAPRVEAAVGRVPRHEFVDPSLAHAAYANGPLPIGHGQTISQPFVVALMTHLARVGPDDVVLEVGTGCGYQTAILCELARAVYSIELVPELAEMATRRLERLGYTSVEVRAGDGWKGWPEHAPFDAIVVTAGAPQVPSALVEQLAPGGRMVIPVGGRWGGQMLRVLERLPDDSVDSRDVLPVMFVPMLHGDEGEEGGAQA